MGILNRFFDRAGKTTTISQEKQGQIFVNALCSNYENFFAQVRPLINDMKAVIPYGVGRNGAALAPARTPELVVLQDPNDEMGWAEFMDAAFSTWLTEDELNIHVWRSGRKVIGYTILPVGSRIPGIDGGEDRFQVTTTKGVEILTRDEVMTLRFSRSPRDLDKGVSPASAAATWAQIDDLVAQYQKAFLENGAIPASITTIRASSKDKYEEVRKDLESGLKGARNRNKTVYIWRQYLPTGEEQDQVEVKTIQGPNSTLALKEINQIVTDRLNKVVGVSNFILGDDSSAKYDNAEQSNYQFISRRVYPALLSFWGQFQHELDRITGGLGYAIQFDLEFPELTDRLKTQAETAKINAESLRYLIEAGARPSAAIRSLGLKEDDWTQTADGIYASVLTAPDNTTQTDKIKTKSSKQKDNSLIIANSTECSCCAASTTKDANNYGYVPVWGSDEAEAKVIYDQLMRILEAIFKGTEVPEEEVKKIISSILNGEADKGANAGAKAISGLAVGKATAEAIKTQLENDGYHLSDEFYERMDARVDTLISKMSDDARAIADATLRAGQEEGLSAAQIANRLDEAMPRFRAELIARNETVNAFRSGRLENDRFLQDEYGLKLGKVWRCVKGQADSEPACPVCQKMDGELTALDSPFPTAEVETEDGKVLSWDHSVWNEDGETPNAHVGCRCYFDEVVLDD